MLSVSFHFINKALSLIFTSLFLFNPIKLKTKANKKEKNEGKLIPKWNNLRIYSGIEVII